MDTDWSRRDLLKSAATGAAALGVGAAALSRSDRYIVGATGEAARDAAIAFAGGRSDRIDLGSVTLVTGQYTESARSSMLGRDDVAFVQRDHFLQAPPPGADEGGAGGTSAGGSAADGQTLPWGIDRVDADVAHEDGATGEGVDVGIVDGGIDPAHPDLADNVAAPGDGAHNAWTDCEGEDCEHPWDDDGGHGTHVAGTVAAVDSDEGVVGVAPEATLHALKVCGGAGRCRTSDIADAIRYAADNGLDVVNLSLGGPGESPALEAAGKYAVAEGLLLVASAGNRGCEGCVGYPAAYDEFVAVSATTIDDDLAPFSSAGEEVDVAAPGQDVCSSVPDSHDLFDGTSMASPHVTGAVAQLLADGRAPEGAREQLLDTAEELGLAGTEEGAGLVDVAAALGMDSADDGTGDGTDCPS